MSDLASSLPGGRYDHDELWRLLAVINDHVYQRNWLLDHAEDINRLIRRAINQPPVYHYAVSTLINLIPVMFANISFKPWWERLLDSLVVAQDIGDQDLIARLSLAITKYHCLSGSSTAAEVIAAVNYAQETTQGRGEDIQLEAYAILIETYIMRPNPNFRPEMFEEALSISARSQKIELKTVLHQMVAVAHLHRRDMDKALFHARKSAELASQIRDAKDEFRSLLISASVLRIREEFDEAARYLAQAEKLFPKTDQTQRNQVLLSYEKAALDYDLDKPAEAREAYLKALSFAEGRDMPYEIALCQTGVALANLKLERFDEAEHYIAAAETVWRRINNGYLVAHAMYTRAYIAFKRDADRGKGLEMMSAALAYARSLPQTKALEWLQGLIKEKIDMQALS